MVRIHITAPLPSLSQNKYTTRQFDTQTEKNIIKATKTQLDAASLTLTLCPSRAFVFPTGQNV